MTVAVILLVVGEMLRSACISIFHTTVWLAIFTTAGMAAQGRNILQSPIQDNDVITYRAPLMLCEIEDKYPDLYIVILAPGVSVEEHTRRVGNGLQAAINRVSDNLYPDKIVYSAKLGAHLLDDVRADSGVELVECAIFKRLSKIKNVRHCLTHL